MQQNKTIKVAVKVSAGPEIVWDCFTNPIHITQWNFANGDWHCPNAENNLEQGGNFLYRMEAKDGSAGFDMKGSYNFIIPFEKIEYTLTDGRKVDVLFKKVDDATTEVIEMFEPDTQNPHKPQQQGWQAILNQFKKYTESLQL